VASTAARSTAFQFAHAAQSVVLHQDLHHLRLEVRMRCIMPSMHAGLQVALSVGVPTLTVLVGILIGTSMSGATVPISSKKMMPWSATSK